MSTIRVVLHFEEDDNNSMQLYQILQNIKRGKRAMVLADNIMANLAEHNLLSTFGSSPEAMASLLTALSTNYRMGIAPQPVSNASAPPAQVQQGKKKPKKNIPKQNAVSKLEDIAPVETTRIVQQIAEPAVAEQKPAPVPTVQKQKTVEVQQPVNSEYLDPLAQGVSQSDDGFSYLDEKKYLSAQIAVAKDYVLRVADPSSREHLAWEYDESRDEDLYDELLPYPSRFNDHPEMYPEGYDNLLTYVTDQLENKKIRKKVN